MAPPDAAVADRPEDDALPEPCRRPSPAATAATRRSTPGPEAFERDACLATDPDARLYRKPEGRSCFMGHG